MPAWIRLLAALTLVLSLVACTRQGEETTTTAPATSSTSATPSTTTTAAETTTAPPEGLDELPEEIRGQVLDLIERTEELRSLDFSEPPTISVVTREELAERVRSDILEDVEDVEADQALYILLGLLPPETDLLALYLDLYGETVAGFYDGDRRELVVPAESDSLGVLERATLVHELTHALTDQEYGIWDRYTELLDQDRFDEAVALLSVIEGDAFLTEILYVQGLEPDQRQEFLAESFEAESDALDQAPQFIRESLVFPYLQGLQFTQRLHDIGGFAEIGEAYRSPPVSTEQVINPRDYQRDLPIALDLPDVSLPGYQIAYESVWGELGFDLMFGQVLGGRDEASEGWGGDAYRVWFDGSEVALELMYQGDEDSDALEMEQALLEYVAAAMDVGEPVVDAGGTALIGEDFAWVRRVGDRVTFLAASDPAAGSALLSAYAAG